MPAGAEICRTMQPAQILNVVVRIGCHDAISANRAERHGANSTSFVGELVNSIAAHAGGFEEDE
jgi:hypothetical protein